MMTSQLVRNILAVYYTASEAQVLEGLQWYDTARAISHVFSVRYHVSLEVVAGVIAALSPQKNWHRNIDEAALVLDMFQRTGSAYEAAHNTPLFATKVTRRKVECILSGASIPEILKGLKLQNFFQCILGNEGVCVDGHAINIATRGVKRVGIMQASKLTPKGYQALAEAYIEAGQQVGLTGCEMQAVTWVTYRELSKGGQ